MTKKSKKQLLIQYLHLLQSMALIAAMIPATRSSFRNVASSFVIPLPSRSAAAFATAAETGTLFSNQHTSQFKKLSSTFVRSMSSGGGGGEQKVCEETTTSRVAYKPKTSDVLSLTPPKVHRDEALHFLAGKVEAYGKDGKLIPRQSDSSTLEMMDPPIKVSDPYGWMRDETREDQRVLNHLKTENDYTNKMTSHLSPLRDSIYDEMLSSIQETDYTTPAPRGLYWYYSRTVEGKSYPIYCRAPKAKDEDSFRVDWDGTADSPILPNEEVYLDVNELAKDKSYCSVASAAVSPNTELLAYAVDFSGDETYQIYVKSLTTGDIVYHDEKLDCSGSVNWGADDATLFYQKMDEAHRPYQVYRKDISEKEIEDELLFEETDELFWVGSGKTLDKRYLMIESGSKETSEIHYIDLEDKGETKLLCVAKRRQNVLYDVSHRNGHWLITTNVGGTPNMRLMTCPVSPDCEENWMDVTTASNGKQAFDGGLDRALDGIASFQTHAVASGREDGIPRVWVLQFDDDGAKQDSLLEFSQLTFDETAYDVGLGGNMEYDTDHVVVSYNSLVTPVSSLRIPLSESSNIEKRVVLKEKFVPGYDKLQYVSERITVPSRDGKTQVPVSIVYRKDTMEKLKSGEIDSAPTHLYGYGSYGACMEASFSVTRLPLLDRGMIYVIAHVRGGGEMGRQWYEEPNGAKYLCKQNTFHDFVDVAKYLINDRKITTPSQLSCEGRSAGGLLVGASINQAPELFKMALLGVPFVDVVPTMVDATIPLTIVEWSEWGNPNESKYFDYMMEYSPINNVQKGKKYPACLLTGGLNDPRVQYWEPAKFAAEIRHQHDEDKSGPVCLKIDMAAGHFSASDRYKYLKELSFDYAFLLDQLGLAKE
eukprot:CAMPEP_0194370542 /NCGR_PEP_ID=MMETSP0174-20130528/18846_1 /TAXON_ID=216777 /ORGANISM="Proboscia alata, Strain PI-D3" /LENGTH=876 /DNA_ID=CAMNT_0039148057 /DNA_START=23 /DNA_END=2653 /DNA_ORIENTATION=+